MARISYLNEGDGVNVAEALKAVQERRGYISNLHRVLAHSVSALNVFEAFSKHVNAESQLDGKTRELLILRTAQHLGNIYEWNRHIPKALSTGLTMDDLSSFLLAPLNTAFATQEQVVLQLVDEYFSGDVSKGTVESVRSSYGEELLIEILMTLGWYLLLSAIILPLDIVKDDPSDLEADLPFANAVTKLELT